LRRGMESIAEDSARTSVLDPIVARQRRMTPTIGEDRSKNWSRFDSAVLWRFNFVNRYLCIVTSRCDGYEDSVEQIARLAVFS